MSGKDVKKLLTQYPIMSRDRLLFKKAGEAFDSFDKAYTSESLWVRYVEITGNNNNDGKSTATAWRTVGYALSMRPKSYDRAIIKIGSGTFTESLKIDSNDGGTVLVGSWEDVYSNIGWTAFSSNGSNSVERWPEVTLDPGTLPVGFWSTDLLGCYIYCYWTSSRTFRAKIIEVDQGNNRLYLGAPVPAILASSTLKVQREATIITSNAPATIAVYGVDTQLRVANETLANWVTSGTPGGVTLHALKLVNTATAYPDYSFAVASFGHCSLGQISILSANAGSSSRALSIYGTLSCTLSSIGVASLGDVAQYLETMPTGVDRVYIYGTLTNLPTSGTCEIAGIVYMLLFYDYSTLNIYLGIAQLPSHIVFSYYYKRYNYTKVQDEITQLTFVNRATFGSAIVTKSHDYERQRILFMGSIDASSKVGFRDAPDAGQGGRIYLNSTELFSRLSIDCGDCSTYVGSYPLITVTNNAILRGKSITFGSSGKECPTTVPLFSITKTSCANVEGLLLMYHSSSVSKATVLVDDNSEILCEAATSNIEIHTTSPVSYGTGVITISGQSKMHCLDDVTIVHTTNPGTGHGLLIDNSEAAIDGAYSSTTTLTGQDLVVKDGKCLIGGAITQNTDGKGIDIQLSDFRASSLSMTGTGTSGPLVSVNTDSRAVFDADLVVPTADYGDSALVSVDGSSKVEFKAVLTDGGASYNRNSNASGRGMDIRRGSQVILASSAGPDGGAAGGNDVRLGQNSSPTSYPSSGASKTDMADGTEGTSEFCAIHVR